jgi:hypothetical protein
MKSNPIKANRIKSCVIWSLSSVSFVLFASCGGGGGGDGNTTTLAASTATAASTAPGFTASLSGAQETPPNSSAATGTGTVTVDPATKAFTANVFTTGIAGTAAHIHDGAPGVAGPIIIPLAQTAPGSGTWTASGTLTDAQLALLNAGNYYFNVHSAAFPNGEIRGQIVPSFTASLSGAQETPPNSSTATGAGIVTVDPAGTKAFTASVFTTGIAGTAAHIHDGAPGVAGPIIIPLAETAPGSGAWTASGTLTDAQLALLNAGNYYFNVHSAAFPNGEIRGQIVQPSSTPQQPASMQPASMQPTPMQPAPMQPAPMQPAPMQPVSVQPAPMQPSGY